MSEEEDLREAAEILLDQADKMASEDSHADTFGRAIK